ncbi:hypothetical protein NDN08_001480 [Rhodosorus marinus]|uniref:Uncharacterized protein n=1 Tax=Rhodosorus marinus TaxID=101924 RepID=A0AAV8UR34_9RHOD|nr:hypothetical protein NDN08_001480 [Rhodosorus marinus]
MATTAWTEAKSEDIPSGDVQVPSGTSVLSRIRENILTVCYIIGVYAIVWSVLRLDYYNLNWIEIRPYT